MKTLTNELLKLTHTTRQSSDESWVLEILQVKSIRLFAVLYDKLMDLSDKQTGRKHLTRDSSTRIFALHMLISTWLNIRFNHGFEMFNVCCSPRSI